MVDNSNCSFDYLTNLPDEIQIMIFSYLNTFDIIQFSKINKAFLRLSFTKELIRQICVSREYRFRLVHLKKFILQKPRTELITSLNINCVYWIPAGEFHNCLEKLANLECLYALDTNLGVTDKDCLVYCSLPKIHTLATTYAECGNACDRSIGKFPEQLKRLCLHINGFCQNCSHKLKRIIESKNVKEIWLIGLSWAGFSIRYINWIPKNVKKVILVTDHIINNIYLNDLNTPFYKGTLRFKRITDISYILIDRSVLNAVNLYASLPNEEKHWNTLLNRLKCEPPFCLSDVKKLSLQQANICDMKFEELNFMHGSSLCSPLLKSTIANLLLTDNMRTLRKLSINFCLGEQKRNNTFIEPLFKRARVGVESSQLSVSALQKIVKHCQLLEELEIWGCCSTGTDLLNVTNTAISSIENLNHMKKLTLSDIPAHVNGQFLINICKGCKSLTSLRILSSKQNNMLNNYLCLAAPHASHLKDLRYEINYIPIDKIFEALNEIIEPKMERLVLKCKTIEKFSVAPFETFLQNNPQLKFLCLIISEVPKSAIRNISKTAHKYKNSPEKVYIITQDEIQYEGRLPIPNVHKYEMLYFKSQIATIDVFDGFK